MASRDGRPLQVAFFGTFDTRTEPRVLVLLEGFRASGDEVHVCNVPLGLNTAERVRLLARPWRLPALALRITVRWWQLWRKARRVPDVDAVIVGYLGHFDVLLARRLWRRTPIVLDHLVSAQGTANDRGLSSRWKDRLLAGLDRRALQAADVPVVDTSEHLEFLDDEHRVRAVTVEVGSPQRWFDAAEAASTNRASGRLRVVFVGRYTPLHGTVTIGAALAELSDAPMQVTMVGSGQELSAARAAAGDASNVRWLTDIDPTPPELIAEHDVALGIFGTTEKAYLVVPNKVFQGAAAGCAIITSDTPPQRSVLGDAALYVQPGDASGLSAMLRQLAEDPDLMDGMRERAVTLAYERFRPVSVVQPLRERLLDLRDDPVR